MQMELPTEPFLIGNNWIDPDYHIPLGFNEPTEYGVFWQEWNGLHYYWLTPEERHQQWWEQEASNHFPVPDMPRYPVAKLLRQIPPKFLEQVTANATRACCKEPVKHDIEVFYSSERDRDLGIPDIYVLHCTCGRKHRRFMVGGGARPGWTVR